MSIRRCLWRQETQKGSLVEKARLKQGLKDVKGLDIRQKYENGRFKILEEELAFNSAKQIR